MKDRLADDYKKIGARIREIRISKGLSQAELSEMAHISLPQISDIELGKSRMLLSSFVKIIEVLQVSADLIIRPNVPGVNGFYHAEFAELLDDCSPREIDAIFNIVKELKVALHSQKTPFDS